MIIRNKDSNSSRKKPPFKIEHFTIRIQEYEVIKQQNIEYWEEIEINIARQRQILKEIGAATSVSLDKDIVKRMSAAYKTLLKENHPICEFILYLENVINIADKLRYETMLENARLEEELRVIHFRNN